MHTTTIRTLAIGVSLLTTLAFGSARMAHAQQIGEPIAAVPPFQLDFDETGASLLNGLPNPNQINFVAGGGIEFYLPGIVQPGQVLISSSVDVDPNNITGDSDLLTFYNGPGLTGVVTGIMLYESLLDPFDPILAADVPRLNYVAPVLSIGELGPEGNNGFSYVVPGHLQRDQRRLPADSRALDVHHGWNGALEPGPAGLSPPPLGTVSLNTHPTQCHARRFAFTRRSSNLTSCKETANDYQPSNHRRMLGDYALCRGRQRRSVLGGRTHKWGPSTTRARFPSAYRQ